MPVRPPHIHLVSLGCAKNLVDSERLLGRLAAAGALLGAPAEAADVIIVNTCGFIAPAKEESIETVLELSRYKSEGRCRRLLVIGCLSQRYRAELKAELTEADGVFGLDEDDAIVTACGLSARKGRSAGRLVLTPKHTAYLRIADGCDNRCAYCAIPLIRGSFRSRRPREILDEAKRLVAEGARELNVIAQDTTRYGADFRQSYPIEKLLENLAAIRGLRWLRLLYTHPAHFSEGLVAAYATIEKLCPYVDLPLQHLNDDILRRMGRRITQAQALDVIAQLRDRVPGVAIRTSLLVGFPGETRAQFNELLALVRDLRFDHLGAFTYSREEGTRAAGMRRQVSERAKQRRLRDLMLTQQDVVREKHEAMAGHRTQVVIESRAPEDPALWYARSQTQAPDVDGVTIVQGRRLSPGRFLNVKITGHVGYDLLASA